jgi:hypothetical protein
MQTSNRIKKKILLNSYLCKKLGIINEEDYKNIINNVLKK